LMVPVMMSALVFSASGFVEGVVDDDALDP
jgi:hypothetical protein